MPAFRLIKKLKRRLYFAVAQYFKFWATIRLRRWRPYIVIVTASSGKTTLLHILEAQIGQQARYSHSANSSFGIPFHILGLERKSFRMAEWLQLCVMAPLALLRPLPKETLYIVEADCDRPGEGKFLADLLKPNMTLWLNVSRSHAQNFSSDEAIAQEFAHFATETTEVAYINADDRLIQEQIELIQSSRPQDRPLKVAQFSLGKVLKKPVDHAVTTTATTFTIENQLHTFKNVLLPKETALSIAMAMQLCAKFNVSYDFSYRNFIVPPGRSSLFAGIMNTTLLDSSYNSNYDSMRVMLELFATMKNRHKWIVLGDMVELGHVEQEEHTKLAALLAKQDFQRLILIGRRLNAWTFPNIRHPHVYSFATPGEALKHIKSSLQGGELIFFKGSLFLEGIIEQLLVNKSDAAKLCRRETIWHKRRRQWGV